MVDSIQKNLKPSPADETLYCLRQYSTILSQISVQLSSVAPQVANPPTPPLPSPQFSLLASDVRVIVFLLTAALAFTLLEALSVILVQQWVRNHMAVFGLYDDHFARRAIWLGSHRPRRHIPFRILKPSSALYRDALRRADSIPIKTA